MSRLTRGRDQLQVWPEVQVLDERRNIVRRPSVNPITVRGLMRPVSTDDSTVDEQQTDTLYRLITRSFPGGPWSRIAWDGRDWDVVGEPEPRNAGATTRHITVRLRARTPRSVPNG